MAYFAEYSRPRKEVVLVQHCHPLRGAAFLLPWRKSTCAATRPPLKVAIHHLGSSYRGTVK